MKNVMNSEIQKYNPIIYAYNIFTDLFGEEAKEYYKDALILWFIVAENNFDRYGEHAQKLNTWNNNFPYDLKKYKALFNKYHHTDDKRIIIDINFSFVPWKIVKEEEDIGGAEDANLSWYTTEILPKHKLLQKDLIKIYSYGVFMHEYFMSGNEDDYFRYIFTKIIGLQPNICRSSEVLEKFIIPPFEDKLAWSEWCEIMLVKLNTARKNLGDGKDAYSIFLQDSYRLILGQLKKRRLAVECPLCNELTKLTKKNKKFCSIKCRKKNENRANYLKNGEKIRKSVNDQRAQYRANGVKK